MISFRHNRKPPVAYPANSSQELTVQFILHSLFCNIVEYAKKVCGQEQVADIIGGLHLMNPAPEQMEGTLEYLGRLGLKSLHACHCTDLQSKIALSRVTNVAEVGVGLEITYN